MKARLVVAGAFVLTFAAGVLTGAILVRQFSRPLQRWEHRPPMGERSFGVPLDFLEKRLDLTPEQSQQIAEIMKKYREQVREHLREVRAPMRELTRQMMGEIDQVLTPEQRERLHAEFRRLRESRGWPRRRPGDTTRQKLR